MVSTTSVFAAVAAFTVAVTKVNAHGYMYIPLAEFTGTATSSWIVQIDPQWSGDWDSCSSDDSDCLTEIYTTLKSSNGYSDIRTLLDSDTDLYGADCGYTDADATAKDPPSTGDATFSRGMVHVGPCEIWLDDTMVLSNDDCMTAYGDGTVDTKSVFTPVDYSSCSTSGCMLRFYWLAFQGVDSEIVWQVYKDCVPLTGPASGDGSSTSTTTTTTSTSDDTTTTSATSEDSTTTASSTTGDEAATTTSSTTSDDTATTTTDSSTTESSAMTDGETTTSSATTGGETTTSSATTGGSSWTASSSATTTESSSWTATTSGSTGGNSWTATTSGSTGGDSWTATTSGSTGGDSWTATTSGSAGGNSWTSTTSGSTGGNNNAWTASSGTTESSQGNGNQGGNGWSGGFGGMGNRLRQ